MLVIMVMVAVTKKDLNGKHREEADQDMFDHIGHNYEDGDADSEHGACNNAGEDCDGDIIMVVLQFVALVVVLLLQLLLQVHMLVTLMAAADGDDADFSGCSIPPWSDS